MENILNCRIKFFGQYRLVEWTERDKRKTDQKYQRFANYLNWHRPMNKNELQNPYIRGTLVRSYMIWHLEEMFAMFKKQFQECCPGNMKYSDDLRLDISEKEKTDFMRRRNRYYKDKSLCTNWEDACLFCQILGAFDAKKFNHINNSKYNPEKDQKSVRFLNFLPDERFKDISDLVSLRCKNRYDRNSKKARDYFKLWEANHYLCSEFFGDIVINKELVGDIDKIKYLISAGLSRINYIAGSPCRIDIGEKKDGIWDISYHQNLLASFYEQYFIDESLKTPAPDFTHGISSIQEIQNKAEEISNAIINAMKRSGNTLHIRSLADAIYDMRRLSDIKNIPEIKQSTNKETFWGLSCNKNKNIKECIIDQIQGKDSIQKQAFFECISEKLYQEAKNLKIIHKSTGRVIGENEYYARQADAPLKDSYDKLPLKANYWIITGYLESKTPFFFGYGSNNGNTDMQILTDSKGNLRLPYDVLRGVLRRDLSSITSNCNVVDIGVSRPCNCPVCKILSQCKFEDSIACNYSIPPEIRQRIKISPQTGVVEHGALFDIEIGPEGLRFPFILKYFPKSMKIDSALEKVLGLWSNEQCFIGGQFGTGKGRFNLFDLNFYKIPFDFRRGQKIFYNILKHRGFIGFEKTKLEELLKDSGFNKKDIYLQEPDKKSYTKIKYNLYFENPVISNDPIAALMDKETPDAIMFKKTVVFYHENEKSEKKEVYSLKGEGIRGVLRYIVGKNENCHNIVHDDCTCSMCSIFGNNQTGGNIRFEDANLLNENIKPVKFDHVALDWNGGAKDHAKFDIFSLPGNPEKPLIFSATIWLNNNLDKQHKKAIKQAFIDLQNKMSTIGANGASGYGWVSKVEFLEPPEWLLDFPEPHNEINNKNNLSDQQNHDKNNNLSKNKLYHPYYFLKPSSHIERSNESVTHESYHNDKLSGKIICDLKTLSPFFIPDTSNDNSLDLILEKGIFPDNHKRFRFFRINDEVMIPGSSIRGMIGYIYQLLTNSCFKTMDEGTYLTRRMEATQTRNFRSGIVIKNKDGSLSIQECVSYRLPLYDDEEITNNIRSNQSYLEKLTSSNKEEKLAKVIEHNNVLAKYAEKNRAYLLNKDENIRIKILSGIEKVKFNIIHKSEWPNGADKIVALNNSGKMTGYIKFTGINNANKKIDDTTDDKDFVKYDNSWDPWKLNILLKSNSPELRPESRKDNYYPRPVLYCRTKDNTTYTISKRCERIFKPVTSINSCDDNIYNVSQNTQNQYECNLFELKITL